MPETAARDSNTRQSLLTCLGHLGRRDINRNDPICVVSTKVAKASTMVTVMCHCNRNYHRCYRSNLRQCKLGFKGLYHICDARAVLLKGKTQYG